MFSIENFYLILHQRLLKPLGIYDLIYTPFGSVNHINLTYGRYMSILNNVARYGKPIAMVPTCYFFDQEPVNEKSVNDCYITDHLKAFKILASSEHSHLVDQLVNDNGYYNWYYFFHGFAALDWFRDAKFLNNNTSWEHSYLCMNRLYSGDRNYRLNLVARLINKDLIKHGAVSLILNDRHKWQDEISDKDSKLSSSSKRIISDSLTYLNLPLVLDSSNPVAEASASLGDVEFNLWQNSLWHVVTETVFYHNKLHLTEKIFKPIVSRRPFILVAAPGNLAYLKSYGFKTFDRWIDESYDNIEDSDLRIQHIVNQVEKICSMSKNELIDMHNEMKEILDFNFNHFWTTFKEKIVNELVDNFEKCIRLWNNGRIDDKALPAERINFFSVKSILLE